MQSNMLTVSQDEYIKMLNLLEYQAKFILKNSDVDKISEIKKIKTETENNIKEYLYMCNDLDVTFTTYLEAKDNYQIDSTYLQQLEETKKQLEDYVYNNFDVDFFINNERRAHRGAC